MDFSPQAILKHVVLLVDVGIYVTVHAEEPWMIYARVSHDASDAAAAPRGDWQAEWVIVRERP